MFLPHSPIFIFLALIYPWVDADVFAANVSIISPHTTTTSTTADTASTIQTTTSIFERKAY